jgi:hypothetical protein
LDQDGTGSFIGYTCDTAQFTALTSGTPKFFTISTGLLAVTNAAAATTPGSVVKKIQVFDGAGASLGYIPVYSTIT